MLNVHVLLVPQCMEAGQVTQSGVLGTETAPRRPRGHATTPLQSAGERTARERTSSGNTALETLVSCALFYNLSRAFGFLSVYLFGYLLGTF